MKRDRLLVLVAIIGAIPQIGAALDGAWHFHGLVEDLLGLPHLLVFGSISANFAYHLWQVHSRNWNWEAVPIESIVAFWGSVLCIVFFILDILSHSLWGFESGIDGIYSISHLGLVVGIAIIASAVFVNYIRTGEGKTGALISFIFTTNMFGILLLPALPFHSVFAAPMGDIPVDFADKFNPVDYNARLLGVVGLSLFTAQMTIFLIAGKKFRVFTTLETYVLFFLINTLNVVIAMEHWEFIFVAMFMGFFAQYLRSNLTYFLFFVSTTFVYFGVVEIVYGVWWEIPMVLGIPVWMGVISILVKLAMNLPEPSPAEE